MSVFYPPQLTSSYHPSGGPIGRDDDDAMMMIMMIMSMMMIVVMINQNVRQSF